MNVECNIDFLCDTLNPLPIVSILVPSQLCKQPCVNASIVRTRAVLLYNCRYHCTSQLVSKCLHASHHSMLWVRKRASSKPEAHRPCILCVSAIAVQVVAERTDQHAQRVLPSTYHTCLFSDQEFVVLQKTDSVHP